MGGGWLLERCEILRKGFLRLAGPIEEIGTVSQIVGGGVGDCLCKLLGKLKAKHSFHLLPAFLKLPESPTIDQRSRKMCS